MRQNNHGIRIPDAMTDALVIFAGTLGKANQEVNIQVYPILPEYISG